MTADRSGARSRDEIEVKIPVASLSTVREKLKDLGYEKEQKKKKEEATPPPAGANPPDAPIITVPLPPRPQ